MGSIGGGASGMLDRAEPLVRYPATPGPVGEKSNKLNKCAFIRCCS